MSAEFKRQNHFHIVVWMIAFSSLWLKCLLLLFSLDPHILHYAGEIFSQKPKVSAPITKDDWEQKVACNNFAPQAMSSNWHSWCILAVIHTWRCTLVSGKILFNMCKHFVFSFSLSSNQTICFSPFCDRCLHMQILWINNAKT